MGKDKRGGCTDIKGNGRVCLRTRLIRSKDRVGPFCLVDIRGPEVRTTGITTPSWSNWDRWGVPDRIRGFRCSVGHLFEPKFRVETFRYVGTLLLSRRDTWVKDLHIFPLLDG